MDREKSINEIIEKLKNEVKVSTYNIVKSEESQLDDRTHLYITFTCERNKDLSDLIGLNFEYHIKIYDLDEFYHLYDTPKIFCYLDLILEES